VSAGTLFGVVVHGPTTVGGKVGSKFEQDTVPGVTQQL
jgi:hypothetical protein